MITMVFRLGWRNIWRNKRRTGVILTAVVIGVWSMIFLSALMRGVSNQMVRNSIAALVGHIQIHDQGYRSDPVIENRMIQPDVVINTLRTRPENCKWAPRIRVNTIVSNARHSGGATLVGIDPELEAGVSFIKTAVVRGRYLKPEDPFGILIGEALLEKFETEMGNKLVLMSQSANGEIASRAWRIVGIFKAEMESTEKQFVFVTLPSAQKMLKVGDDLSEVAVLLPSHEMADKEAGELKNILSCKKYEVLTWKELLPLVTAVLEMYDVFIFIWFLAVFVAMGFGLVNTILMAIFERVREFGLLRAIGLKPPLIIVEVLVESLLLLVIGIIAGNIAGFLSILALSRAGIDLSAFAAGIEFVGMARIIFPEIHIKDILIANTTVLLLGLLVSLYPAAKASGISPVEAMAHN